MAIDEPKYTVVRTYDGFELRRYESYVVAEVEVDRAFSEAGNAAFRILFRYIGGANRASASIDMTAPVTQQPARAGEKIAMTAPVVQSPAGAATSDRHVVGFVMLAAVSTLRAICERSAPEKIATASCGGSPPREVGGAVPIHVAGCRQGEDEDNQEKRR